MSRLWASLPIMGNEPHINAIERWFYECGDEQTHDIACASFELVHCIRVGINDASVILNVSEQDPYERTFYIVYTVLAVQRVINILGGFHCSAVKTRIPLTDLVFSRAFLPLYEDIVEEEHELRMFYIPNVISRPLREVPFDTDALRWRIDYYLGLATEFDDGFSADDEFDAIRYAAYIERVMETSYTIPETALDMTVLRERFHFDFMRVEWKRFSDLWEPVKQTEDGVIRLLLFNGFKDVLQGGMMIHPPPPRDMQSFARRWPSRKPPTCFFKVPMVELPQQLALQLPLYEQGMVHISYLDVPDWVWHLFVIRQQQRAFNTNVVLLPEYQWLKDDVQHIIRHYTLPYVGEKGKRFYSVRKQLETRSIITTESDAELLSFMPPCFRNIMTQGSFMKNAQRLHWVSTLQFAGISRETIAGYLERSNDAHPGGYDNAKARFDYDYVLKKRPGPTFCGNIVQNSNPSTQIVCPFASDVRAKGARDIEEIADGCRAQCAPGQRAFRGPAALIMRNIYRSGRAAKIVEAVTVPVVDEVKLQEGYHSPFESSESISSSSSEDDAGEEEK